MLAQTKYIKLLLGLFLIGLFSCEDPVPTDYIEEKFVEAYLIVNEPIRDIAVMKTQPLNSVFNYDSSFVGNLDVYIIEGENRMKLEFNGKSYYYPDTTYLVKPQTKYFLEIDCIDGNKVSGETTTPSAFSWVNKPKDIIYFPKDTMNLPSVDSLVIEWEKSTIFYLIAITCIDTLEYGKYLTPVSGEMNRRIYKPFSNDRRYKEISSWSFMPNNKTPVVWNYFKWFGMHDVTIYSPDPNFLEWAIQYFVKNSYDPLLGSIKGGIGVFGSAAVVRDTSFLVKNQP
jgi:hypothetical protein